MMQSMATRPPLAALLSFALVAFTIEFDNETDHRLPHRTTNYGPSAGTSGGPWLVSMVMWFNCMRFITEEGIAVREVERLARTRTCWDGMRRWGYVFFEPDPADNRPKPPQPALIVRVTHRGRVAQELWAALIPAVEELWRKRFGGATIDDLRSALAAVVSQMGVDLPDCLPILKYGLVSDGPKAQKSAPTRTDISSLPLPALLAKVLLAFALEFERESDVSLAICADVLRVVDEKGTPVRDLPVLGGISKEAVAMALSFLTKRGYARVRTDGRVKRVLLTPAGVKAQADYPRLVKVIEKRWVTRYGAKTVQDLRVVLERIAGDGAAEGSPLFQGLEPYPEGWRARVREPATLPHYPMVLHRGGYPDGS
jgi:predicted transcriptional regulator